ncbi:MAG: histidine phosphatase family protein [Rhodospirillales bacterium]
MVVRLTLICHAPTAAVRAAAFPADEPLDERGEAAAAGLGAAVTFPAVECWSAPELRARQTAAALGLTATIDARLRDGDYGRWRGSALAAVQAREPDAIRQWLADPATAPHGGESVLDLLARVGGWLDQLRRPSAQRGTARLIAVTHPAVVKAAIVTALAAPPAAFWRIDAPPLSRVHLVGHAGRWNLRLAETDG